MIFFGIAPAQTENTEDGYPFIQRAIEQEPCQTSRK
jgi:hypothetical protein